MYKERVIRNDEKTKRFLELFERLRALYYLRYHLLETFEMSNHDYELYLEMNETISEEENRLWKYIDGEVNNY